MRARSAALLTTILLALGVVTAPPASAIDASNVTVRLVTGGGTAIPEWNLSVTTTDGAWVAVLTTDASGSAVVELPDGEYVVSAWTGPEDDEVVSVAGAAASVTVTVQELAVVSGTVRDAVTGGPIDSVVSTAPETTDAWEVQSTGDTGAFRLTLPVGRYALRAWSEAYLTGSRTLELKRGTDVLGIDLRLNAKSHLSGTLTAGGKKVGADVRIGHDVWASTTDGRYSTGVTAGQHIVTATPWDQRRYLTTYSGNTVRKQDAKPVVVSLGHDAVADITVAQTAAVTGTVVDRRGRAAKYVEVWATNLDRAGEAHVTTDGKGRFTLRGLATGHVRIDVAGGTDARPAFGHRTVTARQGATVTAAVTLRDDAIIYGKVRTTGSRVTKQDVTVRTADGVIVATVRPEADGFVGIGGLAPGTYYVHVDGGNLRRKVVVKAHQSVSWGTMTRGRLVTVKGVVKTSAGRPAAGATVLLTDRYSTGYAFARTNAKGAWSAKVAVADAYTIVVRPKKPGADTTTRVRVTVRKGTTLTKNVRLTKGATVTGVVLNAQGEPAIGVRVETYDGRRATTTNASGAYTLTGVEPVRQRLWVSDPAYVGGYRNGSTLVTARAGKTVKAPRATVR